MTDPTSKHRVADWFRQWRKPLRKFLVIRGGVPASDLDDVAQEVFLRLMRYGRTELIEHPQAYLYKMATNVAAEWAIRGRFVRMHDAEWVAGFVGGELTDEAQDQVCRLELEDEIERAILTLTAQQREVLKLQFFAGLSRAEVAAETGLSERSVKRALIKSYQKLRDQLNTELFTGTKTDGPK